jgi:hypothetical protein
MKNVLITYLVVQPVLIEQVVTDTDSLFKFFLIDVQMSSCLQTSRIKQAISTVQLFVRRCLLGLELDPDKQNQSLLVDPLQWRWMSTYRVWETNRRRVYRQLGTIRTLWTSWEKLSVNMPNYTVKSPPGVVSERRDGVWTTKAIPSNGMYGKASDLTTYAMPGLDTFVFIPRITASSVTREQNLSIDVLGDVTDRAVFQSAHSTSSTDV